MMHNLHGGHRVRYLVFLRVELLHCWPTAADPVKLDLQHFCGDDVEQKLGCHRFGVLFPVALPYWLKQAQNAEELLCAKYVRAVLDDPLQSNSLLLVTVWHAPADGVVQSLLHRLLAGLFILRPTLCTALLESLGQILC